MSETQLPVKSYDLITNDLVEQALKRDVGPEAELTSWEIKDFTNVGDNYQSIVTSIMVKYKRHGRTSLSVSETSYVAKLNPLRPVSSFTVRMDIMYSREAIVLNEIADGLNEQLKRLNLPLIKVPRLYACSLENGKQVIITENLRKEGFRMYDRKKGMDMKHALLVVEELGRFHASSLLFEDTLFPKTIEESFDYFEEPWTDFSHPSFKIFNLLMVTQCQSVCEFLKKAPTYEKCSKWITDKLDYMGKFFVEGFSPSKSMDILNHGDCWTNNMLFKYDGEGNPIDIRFVDLQLSKKSSPACDMNYFYYTSLNGDVRKKYMKTLEKAYYNSFVNVLELAGKEPPFTFSEFENEMINRKQFGLVAGMLVLPVILAEGDAILDLDKIDDEKMEEFMRDQKSKFAHFSEKEGPFKDRFLSMFDEMLEYKIFDA